MVVRDACPAYRSNRYKKNGHTYHGKQSHQCEACDRQFVATAENPLIAHEQRTLIERLLGERISLGRKTQADYFSSGYSPAIRYCGCRKPISIEILDMFFLLAHP